MGDPIEDLKEKQERLKKEIEEAIAPLKAKRNRLILSAAWRIYLGIAAATIAGALLLKPIWVAAKFLWNLY